MMYMNQQAMATYDAIKKQDLLEPQLRSRSKLRRWCYNMKKGMIISPARNFVLSVAAGFIFNLAFMASIIIIYEEVSSYTVLTVSAVHPGQLIRLLGIDGAHHRAHIFPHCDSDPHHFLAGSGLGRQRVPGVA